MRLLYELDAGGKKSGTGRGTGTGTGKHKESARMPPLLSSASCPCRARAPARSSVFPPTGFHHFLLESRDRRRMMHVPGRVAPPFALPLFPTEEFAMRTKLLALAAALAFAASGRAAEDGLTKGTPELKSATALAFGPHGLLFVGDSQSATIFAIDTADAKPAGTKDLNVEKIDGKIAAALGVTEKEVKINDVKVNPASGNIYLAVARGTGAGQAAIMKVTRDGAVESMPLKDVMFSKVALPNPAQGKGAATSITCMAFLDGRLFVAGLSSEEFKSTLRAIPFPFKDADKGTGIQIYHGNHAKLETEAPIRTFTPYKIDKEENILASYTCTPLVKIPVSDLKPGAKVKGTTIAELGNQNVPLDMIAYTKDGKEYLLMANNSRGVMKIPTAEFGTATPITAKVGGTAGPKYETISELKDVTQLDKLDDTRAVILVEEYTGQGASRQRVKADLKTIPLP